MKYFASTARNMLVAALLGPMACWAGTWSSCQTITSVTDYTGNNNSFYVNLSPGIPGCQADTVGAAIFQYFTAPPAGGLTFDAYKNLYTTTLLAYSLGKRVTIFYNTSAPACYGTVVSIGGIANECN